MTRAQVEEKLAAFLELTDQEQELREELLRLKLWGHKATEKEATARLQRQEDLLARLEALRTEGMLPILEELGWFIANARKPEGPAPKATSWGAAFQRSGG